MLLLDPQELEYLLEHLGHPETLKEKKFQEWLLDNDHRQLFERDDRLGKRVGTV